MKASPAATDHARRYSPVWQIVLARLREFYREPEAMFWVYGFPMLMIISLGLAFRNKTVERVTVDVQASPSAAAIEHQLADQAGFVVSVHSPEECRGRLRTGKTDLVIIGEQADKSGGAKPAYEFWFDPSRPESVLARNRVDDLLERAAGRQDLLTAEDRPFDEPGGRYVDFLVPGLLGMSLMGGGLWGVGFVTVDMRIRKLLKRFLATPMQKRDFLAGIMLSRLLIMLPEVLVLLAFARLVFGVQIHGSPLAVALLILLGAMAFAGLGLLLATRARTIEAVSGLMNLVMLPMWLLSGIFFSSDRFPDWLQPLIHALPLTMLIGALRGIMQEGVSLAAEGSNVAGLTVWAVVCFALAVRFFRWT